nr:hypothetical protein [Rhodoferax sp.]
MVGGSTAFYDRSLFATRNAALCFGCACKGAAFFAILQPDAPVRRALRFAESIAQEILKVIDDMKLRYAVAPMVGLALVACGGGSASTPVAEPPVATVSIFSDPVDVKCDTFNGEKICDAPTSSKMDKAKLQAFLTDPTASSLKFKEFGYEFAYDNARARQSNGPFLAVSGQAAYGGSGQELNASTAVVRFTGTTYPFLKIYPGTTYSRGYCLSQKQDDCMFVNPVNISSDDALYADLVPVVYTQRAAVLTTDSLTSHIKTWNSYFGAVSDRTDVAVPGGGIIKYVGTVWFRGGDGSPVNGGITINAGIAACPIELSLNASTGKISAADIACAGNATGDLSISLPALMVAKSKVQQINPTDSATGSTKVILEIVTSGSGAPPPNVLSETFKFEISKIAGGLYGSNARTLLVMGSGSQGVMSIVARRQ